MAGRTRASAPGRQRGLHLCNGRFDALQAGTEIGVLRAAGIAFGTVSMTSAVTLSAAATASLAASLTAPAFAAAVGVCFILRLTDAETASLACALSLRTCSILVGHVISFRGG